MTTGQRIKTARKKAGITQAELGKILGVSGSMIAQYETDKRNPKYDTLKRIATALGVGWTELVPEEQQGQTVIDHINEKLAGINIEPGDEEILKDLLPKMSELDPLTDEEAALKTLLNSMGYDIIKTRGEYFFNYECGGSEISVDDLNELLNCAQNGLKVAAKTLELKLMQEALAPFSRAETVIQSPPAPQEGTDTTLPQDAPEPPSKGTPYSADHLDR